MAVRFAIAAKSASVTASRETLLNDIRGERGAQGTWGRWGGPEASLLRLRTGL